MLKIIIRIITAIILIAGYIAINFIPSNIKEGLTPHDTKSHELSITAHRGASGLAPENSMEAFRLAVECGSDFVECDIHLTKDGEVVVCHDLSIDRTTNGKGEIKDMTLAQIRQYNLLGMDGEISEAKIPTLSELLELINGQTNLLIEIKRIGDIYHGLEQAVVDDIEVAQAHEWVVVQSFDDYALEQMYKIEPSIPLEKLFVFKFKGLPLIFDGGVSIFTAKRYQHVRSFNPHYKYASPSLIKEIHKMGKGAKVWTVDSGETLVPDVGLDGIITNHPEEWIQPRVNAD